MATYKAEKETKTRKSGDMDDFTKTMLERADDAFGFEGEQRRKVVEDMKFVHVPGNQWDQHLTSKRRRRPCYEFNRTRQMVRAITGQALKNKPNIKVRAVEDNDIETAEIYNGLIKNIENQSSAETAYDVAMNWSTTGGYGLLMVTTEYCGPDTFDQELRVVTIMDPTRWYCDPAAVEFDRSDARYWFGVENMARAEFKRRWPKAEVVDFKYIDSVTSKQRDWYTKDEVRVAQYWYVEHEKKTIHLLSDGSVVKAEEFDPIADELARGVAPDGSPVPPVTIKQSREVDVPCVYSVMVSGKGKLEEPKKWPGTMIPIVPQWGDLISIDGRQHFCGMARFGRDAQVIHNFEMSTMVEVVAKLPNSPITATPAMIKGLESYYERMGADDAPVLLFNVDPTSPTARPTREPPATLPAGMAALSAMMGDELKTTLGVYDASLGAQANETSGRALIARQNQADTTNFVYSDNQAKAIKRLGTILVDAIPGVYDADRTIRILGDDNAEKFVRINRVVLDEQTGEQVVLNDLSRGKYDVTVTVGKAFDTARMELAEAAMSLSAQPGPFAMLGQFMLLKSLDVPGMDEFVKAARKMLVAQGLLEAGEGDQPPAPPPPNPKDVAGAEKDKATADKTKAETQGIELDNAAKAAELQLFGIPVDRNGPKTNGAAPGGLMGAPPMTPDGSVPMGPPPGVPGF